MKIAVFRDPGVLFILLVYIVGALSLLFFATRKRTALIAALTAAFAAVLLTYLFGW